MKWFTILLIIGGALALGRIFLSLRQLRNQRRDDWDTRLIARLRKSGFDPFKPHELDFFMALPTEAAAREAADELRGEGMSVDVRETPDNPSHPWSLHVRKTMQLSIDLVRATSTRLETLAIAKGGRYDGWAAVGTRG